MFHFMFLMVDVILDNYADKSNLEEPASLSRLIQLMNPRLENKKGKDAYYQYRDLLRDIYIGLLGEFFRSFMGSASLESDITPMEIKLETNQLKKQQAFESLVRKFIISTHAEYSDCHPDVSDGKLPDFYPHQEFIRQRHKDLEVIERTNSRSNEAVDDAKASDEPRTTEVADQSKSSGGTKPKKDLKQDYSRSMLAFLGVFVQMIESVKEANGLDCYLLQKKVHKIVQGSGHKNYACSIASYKQNVLGHKSPKFSHAYMWNLFAGRPGPGMKMARDQRVEHLDRFLKEGFKSLGVNLDEKNAKRINNSADIGQKIEVKINEFYHLDVPGKSHKKKDRTQLIKKLTDLFKKEKVSTFLPNRRFKGPNVSPALENDFDEAQFLSWHHSKSKELLKFSQYKEKYSKSSS